MSLLILPARKPGIKSRTTTGPLRRDAGPGATSPNDDVRRFRPRGRHWIVADAANARLGASTASGTCTSLRSVSPQPRRGSYADCGARCATTVVDRCRRRGLTASWNGSCSLLRLPPESLPRSDLPSPRGRPSATSWSWSQRSLRSRGPERPPAVDAGRARCRRHRDRRQHLVGVRRCCGGRWIGVDRYPAARPGGRSSRGDGGEPERGDPVRRGSVLRVHHTIGPRRRHRRCRFGSAAPRPQCDATRRSGWRWSAH